MSTTVSSTLTSSSCTTRKLSILHKVRLNQCNVGTMMFSIVVMVLFALISVKNDFADAYPLNIGPNNEISRKHPVTLEIDNPEEVLSVLDNLMQNIVVGIDLAHTGTIVNDKSTGNKRGIDLGLSRGFSGSQAAKHLMGMSAASFANGPGRRRK